MQSEDQRPPSPFCSFADAPRPHARVSAVRRFAFVIGGFLAFDLVAPSILFREREPSSIGIFLGGVLAEGSLIAIWAALGTTVYWPVRQMQALLLALLACWCLWIGVGMTELAAIDLRAFAVTAAFVPLLLLGAQLPLWVWRLIRAWRIARGSVGRAGVDAAGRQFDLRDLLLIAAVVAVPLGFVRFGLWLDPNEAAPAGIAILVFIAALASAFTTLPCTWSALGAARHDAGCFAIALYALALPLLVYLGSAALSGAADFEALAGLMSTCFAGTGTTHLVLLAFRDCGYRLHSVRKPAIAGSKANEHAASSPGEGEET